MSDADCIPGREPRSVAASPHTKHLRCPYACICILGELQAGRENCRGDDRSCRVLIVLSLYDAELQPYTDRRRTLYIRLIPAAPADRHISDEVYCAL